MRRPLRSLHAQLFLWAVMPVTFAIIALAFTGVYSHQQAMRDFVAERDLALARLTARMVEDGLAHGMVGADGSGLVAWMMPLVDDQPGAVLVVDRAGRALAHPDPQRVGADAGDGTHPLQPLKLQELYRVRWQDGSADS